MDCPQLLHQLVKREILTGQSPIDSFCRLQQQLSGNSISLYVNQIKKWLNDMELDSNDIQVACTIPAKYHLLLQTIRQEFQKAKNGTARRKCSALQYNNCKMFVLSDRYSIDVGLDAGGAIGLHLFDNFYGQERQLNINGKLPSMSADLQFHAIDPNHFLLIQTNYSSAADTDYTFSVYLLELDVRSLECTVLDECQMEGCLYRFVLDSTDSQKFALVLCYKNAYWMRKGRLNGNKLEICTEQVELKFNSWYSSLNLEDNKLHGIYVQDRCGHHSFIFNEMQLNTTQSQFVHLGGIDADCEIDPSDYMNTNYVWFQNTCYLLKVVDNAQLQIFQFDTKSQKMTKFIEMPISGPICNHLINQNGILSLCTLNSTNGQHVWLRIPLKNPDQLFTKAMVEIQKQLMFMDEREYSSYIQRVPLSLRPFN
ncbi:hypothetical protein M3Y97_01094300 [Aphelenchoides bicaudatus]|nr:hypothetical protein M3Y97_01094300 [Aphelenchoides bicaudatus]